MYVHKGRVFQFILIITFRSQCINIKVSSDLANALIYISIHQSKKYSGYYKEYSIHD